MVSNKKKRKTMVHKSDSGDSSDRDNSDSNDSGISARAAAAQHFIMKLHPYKKFLNHNINAPFKSVSLTTV